MNRSNSKKGLNDFWSDNLAKGNQAKMGWNYNKIMASKVDNTMPTPIITNKNNNHDYDNNNNNKMNSNMNNNAGDANLYSSSIANLKNGSANNPNLMGGYKLQKNMSLSQLDQRIRQNVSREELYNLICNNEQPQQNEILPTSDSIARNTKNLLQSSINSINNNTQQNPQKQQISLQSQNDIVKKIKSFNQSNQIQKHQQQWPQTIQPILDRSNNQKSNNNSRALETSPLSKSISQTSVPSLFAQLTKKKSPRKASIPLLFKPLCKSTSNTHVFNRNYDVSDEPQETFTPKILVKSSSSSSIFNIPSANYFNTIRSANDENKKKNQLMNFFQQTTAALPTFTNTSQHNKISKINEQLQQNKNFVQDSATIFKQQQDANNFFVKQNIPQLSKATVNYPPLKSKSSMQIPFYGNLPSAYSNNNNLFVGTSSSNNANKNHR